MRNNISILSLISLVVMIFGYTTNGYGEKPTDKPTDYVNESDFDAAYYNEGIGQWMYLRALGDSTNDEPTEAVLFDPDYEIYGAESGLYWGDVTLPEQFEYNGKTFIIKMIAAFEYSSVNSIVIPNSVEDICGSFYNCWSLTDVKLSENIKELSGFIECRELTKIEIPEGIQSLNRAFNANYLNSIDFPNSVKIINNAFNNSRNLKSIDLNNVRSVKLASFMNSPMLENVVINESTDSISDRCFNNCESLKTIELPAKRVIIEDSFNGCPAVEEIIVKATQPYPFPETSFKDVDYDRCNLVVPTGSGDLYRNAEGWNRFSIIKERTLTGVENISEVYNDITIHSVKGGLNLSCEQPCDISIFNIDGTLNGNYYVNDKIEILLPEGIYLVRTPTKTHKIIIV